MTARATRAMADEAAATPSVLEDKAAPEAPAAEGAAVVTPIVDVKAQADKPKAEAKKKSEKKDKDEPKAKKSVAQDDEEPKAKIKPRVAGKTPDWNEPIEW